MLMQQHSAARLVRTLTQLDFFAEAMLLNMDETHMPMLFTEMLRQMLHAQAPLATHKQRIVGCINDCKQHLGKVMLSRKGMQQRCKGRVAYL